jgi:membrane-associated phospholipid phosphatase
MGIVWAHAGAAAVPRFWMTVLVAGFACYASLPWLVSRPPKRLASHASGAVTRLNAFVLSRASHQWTTFPSGHAAVAWAAAFAVARVWPVAGVVLAMVAAGVSVGAASGRYHYVIDVLLGLLVAAVAAVIT